MSAFMDFAQILEGKIRNDIENSMGISANSQQKQSTQRPETFSQSKEIDTDPAHLAYLMSQVNMLKTANSPRETSNTSFKTGYPQPAPRPVKPHSLTPLQARAHRFFASHGLELSPAFSAKELKKGFWTLAKKLHPDCSKGSSGPFIELKSAYRELQTLFKSVNF